MAPLPSVKHLRMSASVIAIVVMLSMSLAVLANATVSSEPPGNGHRSSGAIATFDGGKINLAQSWEGARACNVLSQAAVQCYWTRQEADAAIGFASVPSGFTVQNGQTVPECAYDWICIYQHINGDGRRLIFNEDIWHDLREYGFSNQVSSYRNRQDPHEEGWLYSDGDGDYMYRIQPWSYVSDVGDYNDRADWIIG